MPNAASISTITYYSQLLEECTRLKSLKQAKILHACLLKLNGNDFGAHSSLLPEFARLYIACNKPQPAHHVFNSMPLQHRKTKTILWNQIIRAYAWEGPFQKALLLYNEMMDSGVTPTKFTYPFVLKACSALQDVSAGLRIHGDAKRFNLHNDVYVCTALVDFYVKCGCLLNAREVFDGMPEKDVVAWNAMILGYSSHGLCGDAITLFLDMQRTGVNPNSSTVIAILPAFGETSAVKEGKAVHGFCLRRGYEVDVVVGTGILDMYGKCGQLVHARRIFDALAAKNEVTWSAMIGAYVICDSICDGFELFWRMRVEVGESASSPIVLSTMVRACAKLNDENIGRQLHGYIVKLSFLSDLMVANTILSMYSKCGLISDAKRFFEEMKVKDPVSYNALIAGCVQNGFAEKALQVFHQMQLAGFEPELATMMGFYPACSYLAALQHGVCGHGYSVVRGFTSDISVCNALINMYSKCGKMDDARKVFDRMPHKDVVSWNAMILGYGIHGLGNEAFLLFHDMQKGGCKSDEVTFIALLSTCSHSGLVSEGKHLFSIMESEFNIVPRMDHYYCMVDMLGRAGLLNEAYGFISKMPFDPDVQLWNALLAACRVHKNIELGEEVSNKILNLGPTGTGNFVLLFNLYATAQRWDDAANVRIQQKEMGFKKKPGCSWIEVNGTVHAFVGGDRSHQQSSEIYGKLEELLEEMKRLGYRAECDFVYHDVEDEEKEQILRYHSEKLAVAFGIISLKGSSSSSSSSKPIIVTKNLRVCGDCHAALKYITIITKREITVRDTSRFHHFKDGICSCGDFW